MLMRTCDIQYLDPGEQAPPPAPTTTDPALHAKLATAARSQRGRRFAFCELAETRARVVFQGIQASDGSCVLLDVGRPIGWYTSIDAAYAHRGREGLVLVWTEPVNPPRHSNANLEAMAGDPSIWLVLLPFRAHGPHDARIRAIEIATAFEDTVPGLTREMALMASAQDGGTPITLFCPNPGCLREPYHHGNHQPTSEDPESNDDAAAGEPARRQPIQTDNTSRAETNGDNNFQDGETKAPHANGPEANGGNDSQDGEADA